VPTLVIAALLVLAFVPSAFGASQRSFKETFGSVAQPNFGSVRALSVDRETGDILVADKSTETLSRFHADGAPAPFAALGTNVISETPAGHIQITPFFPIQIAVDETGGPTDGDIYLTQSNLVDVFGASGLYLGQLTKAGSREFAGTVDGVTVGPEGAVYVNNGSVISKFLPSASPVVNADLVANFEMTHGTHGVELRNLAAGR
jgi:hypothetical protein